MDQESNELSWNNFLHKVFSRISYLVSLVFVLFVIILLINTLTWYWSQKSQDESTYKYSSIYNLNLENKNFNRTVKDEAFFSIRPPYEVDIRRTFSIAYVIIRSNETCSIYTDINCNQETRMQQDSIFNSIQNAITSMLIFSISSENKCDHTESLPLFEEYCFAVKLRGSLEVQYFYDHMAYQKMVAFCSGIFLYCIAERLSKNRIFHYFMGVGLGTMGSILFLILFLLKYASIVFSFLIYYYFYSNFKETDNYYYSFIVASGIMFSAYFYYRGPISDPKVMRIIKWFLRIISLACIYWATSYLNVALFSAGIVVLSNEIDRLNKMRTTFMGIYYKLKFKYFPTKRKFLTINEYNRESQDFTKKSLDELKRYCKSPQCEWRLIARLSISKLAKFANFISNDEFHLSNDELSEYEIYSMRHGLVDNLG